MYLAQNAVIHAINFVKTNLLNDGVFVQFFETENLKTLLLYPEVRWLSKGLSLERLVILWKQVIDFIKFKSQMVDCKYRKQAGKAREILEKLENTEIKSKIYYLKYAQLRATKKSDLVICTQQIKGYIQKLKYWKKTI